MPVVNVDTSMRRITEGCSLGTGPDNVKGSVWILVSNVAAAAIEAANYLNPVKTQLRVGDIIIGSLDNDGAPARKDWIVTAVSPNVVIAAEA